MTKSADKAFQAAVRKALEDHDASDLVKFLWSDRPLKQGERRLLADLISILVPDKGWDAGAIPFKFEPGPPPSDIERAGRVRWGLRGD